MFLCLLKRKKYQGQKRAKGGTENPLLQQEENKFQSFLQCPTAIRDKSPQNIIRRYKTKKYQKNLQELFTHKNPCHEAPSTQFLCWF